MAGGVAAAAGLSLSVARRPVGCEDGLDVAGLAALDRRLAAVEANLGIAPRGEQARAATALPPAARAVALAVAAAAPPSAPSAKQATVSHPPPQRRRCMCSVCACGAQRSRRTAGGRLVPRHCRSLPGLRKRARRGIQTALAGPVLRELSSCNATTITLPPRMSPSPLAATPPQDQYVPFTDSTAHGRARALWQPSYAISIGYVLMDAQDKTVRQTHQLGGNWQTSSMRVGGWGGWAGGAPRMFMQCLCLVCLCRGRGGLSTSRKSTPRTVRPATPHWRLSEGWTAWSGR